MLCSLHAKHHPRQLRTADRLSRSRRYGILGTESFLAHISRLVRECTGRRPDYQRLSVSDVGVTHNRHDDHGPPLGDR